MSVRMFKVESREPTWGKPPVPDILFLVGLGTLRAKSVCMYIAVGKGRVKGIRIKYNN